MANSLDEQLKLFMGEARKIDKETHHLGTDQFQDKVYDVDRVNLKRILTGREAANIYQALEEHQELILYSSSMECDLGELESIEDGRRWVPASDVQVVGYHVLLSMSALGVDERERILSFAERQLPTDQYRNLFSNFLKSRKNQQKALDTGMSRISVYAGDGIYLLSVDE